MTHRKDLGIAIADVDAARARDLAQKVGAAFHTADNLQAISHPEHFASPAMRRPHYGAGSGIRALEMIRSSYQV